MGGASGFFCVGVLEALAGLRLLRGRHRSDDAGSAGDRRQLLEPSLAEHRPAADLVALLRHGADDLVAERLHQTAQLLEAGGVRDVIDARDLNADQDGARRGRVSFHDRAGSTNRAGARGIVRKLRDRDTDRDPRCPGAGRAIAPKIKENSQSTGRDACFITENAGPGLSLPPRSWRWRRSGPLAPASAQSGAPIRIGYSMALTGGLAPNGKSALLAQKIWEEDVNAKGGLLGVRSSSSITTTRAPPPRFRPSTPSCSTSTKSTS